MEASAGRGGSLPVPSSSSQPPRKEWRAVPEDHHQEHSRLGQSDERTIYEEGSGRFSADFCSITIDGSGGLSDEILQSKLQEIMKQREELQHVEIELRAQAIARAEILELQNCCQARIKEHSDAASQLKEQLKEKERHIEELEMKLEEKDRELRAVKLDNEAAWAKDDLLREQNKELATFRRERDNSEVERSQLLKQIHELQELIQEKDSQILAVEEQHRAVQESILIKDEHLRNAQTWIARVQEMDALQSTKMQAELQERTEQFNQYWIGLQRQFAEVERHHLQTIQQLQLELAEVRERNGICKEDPEVTRQNSTDSSSYIQTKGNQINANDAGVSNGNLSFMSNGNLEGHPYTSSSDATSKAENAAGIAVVPSPIIGMGAFIPQNQMTALHPFVMHPQGVPQSVSSNSQIPQSHAGHFQPMTTVNQHWQQQQAMPDVPRNPNQNSNRSSQTEQNLLGEVIHSEYPNTHIEQQQRSSPAINGINREEVVLDSNSKQYQASQEPQQASNASATFHPTLVFTSPEHKSEVMVQDQITVTAIDQQQEQWSASIANISDVPSQQANSNETAECNEKVATLDERSSPTARTTNPMLPAKATEPTLLDERSLLACIVRTIPAGAEGRIRISTTLPNRLAKMLAPLHWHDYKKCYGKLDDFVAHHPELFVIEGDYIHLREGAQEIISATTAFAKVAAAASSAPYSLLFPSVALTPVAQSSRQKTGDSSDKHSQISKRTQQSNGVGFNVAKGLSDMNVSVKSKNLQEVNGLSSETRIHSAAGNGTNKGLSRGKQQARSAGAGIISRR
ncbi:LOW QUALITY PROTEIN: uncharacterized protein LOC109822297 [Asparagus officinalis]|uniref:LOW QUALITY PROTEIN: uncharacterized protein LOC109822297 n=1 Tax=Asparagus officinalis TaxID=4686 RepID=UPI00098E4A4B|nr:LOW QUALITY PROTEIN: uncharacterized protein LOC109822297 [Asparagus officinalis]